MLVFPSRGVLALFLALIFNAQLCLAWNEQLIDASKAFNAGTATPAQRVMLLARNYEVNLLAMAGKIDIPAFNACQKDFMDISVGIAQNAADHAEVSFTVQKPKSPPLPGTDSDYITGATNVDQVKAMQKEYNQEFTKKLKEMGGNFDEGTNWIVKNDIDFMGDASISGTNEFLEIAKANNAAYTRTGAARYEAYSRMDGSRTPNLSDTADYVDEMQDMVHHREVMIRQHQDELARIIKENNVSRLSDFPKGSKDYQKAMGLQAEIYKNKAIQGKYMERIADATDDLKKLLPPDTKIGNKLIGSSDLPKRAKIRDMVGSRMNPEMLHTMNDDILRQQLQEHVEVLAAVAHTNPARAAECQAAIKKYSAQLTPQQKADVIDSIRQGLGPEAARDLANTMRGASSAATLDEAIGAIKKGTAELNDAMRRGDAARVRSIIDDMNENMGKSRNWANLEGEGPLKEITDRFAGMTDEELELALRNNPGLRSQLDDAMRAARTDAHLLGEFAQSTNAQQRLALKGMLSEVAGSKTLWGELKQVLTSVNDVIPIDKALMAIFVYWDTLEASQRAGEGDLDGAGRKAFEALLGAFSGVSPALMAALTNTIIDATKAAGFEMAVASQDCEDLLVNIVSVSGWESASGIGDKSEISIERLARQVAEEKAVRNILEKHITNLSTTQDGTHQINEGKKKALSDKCTERIVSLWRKNRTSMVMNYIVLLSQLEKQLSSMPIDILFSPPEVDLAKEGDAMTVDMEIRPEPKALEKANTRLARLETELKTLGGIHKLTALRIVQTITWKQLSGITIPEETSSVSKIYPVLFKAEFSVNKKGAYAFVADITWDIEVINAITDTGDHMVGSRNFDSPVKRDWRTGEWDVNLTLNPLKWLPWKETLKEGDPVTTYQNEMERKITGHAEGWLTAAVPSTTAEGRVAVKVNGPAEAEQGSKVELSVNVKALHQADTEFAEKAEIEWFYLEKKIATGRTYSFKADKPLGTKLYTAKALGDIKGEKEILDNAVHKLKVVAPPEDPKFKFRIDGPSQVNVNQPVSLKVVITPENDTAREAERRTYGSWTVNGQDFGPGDVCLFNVSDAGEYKAEAVVILDDKVLTTLLHTVSVKDESQQAADDEIEDDKSAKEKAEKEKAEKEQAVKEQAQKEKEEQELAAKKLAEQQKRDQEIIAQQQESMVGYQFAGSFPSVWEGGGDATRFGFNRAIARFNNPHEMCGEATAVGTVWGKLKSTYAVAKMEDYAETFKNELKDHKSWHRAAELKGFSMGGFSGQMVETKVSFTGGGYSGDYRSSEASALAHGYVVKGNQVIEFGYNITGSGCFNNTDRAFIESQVASAQGEAKGILASIQLVNDGKFEKTPYKGPKLDGSSLPKISLSPASLKPLKLGETATVTAVVEGAQPEDSPFTYNWSGEFSGKGSAVTLTPKAPGKFTISVAVEGAQYPLGSASLEYEVADFKATIERVPNTQNPVAIGGSIGLKATLLSGGSPTSGEYVYRWQPHPEVTFKDLDSNSNQTTARFTRLGNVRVWVQVLKKEGELLTTITESEQLDINVTQPNLALTATPAAPLVGEVVKLKVVDEPAMDDTSVSFWWEVDGNTLSAGALASEREYTFIPKDTRPIVATVHAKGLDNGDDLGQQSITVTAKHYSITVSKPKPRGPTPQIWKEGKGLVDVENAIAVFQDVTIGAAVSPAPKNTPLSYQWTINPEGCTLYSSISQEITANASHTGTYNLQVSVKDAKGIELGTGNGTLAVTVSQAEIKSAQQKSSAASGKFAEAKESSRLGKYDEAIASAEQALAVDPGNKEISGFIEQVKSEKASVDNDLAKVEQMINVSDFAAAQAALRPIRTRAQYYPPSQAMDKKLSDALQDHIYKVQAAFGDIQVKSERKDFKEALEAIEQTRNTFKLSPGELQTLSEKEAWCREMEGKKERARVLFKSSKAKLAAYDYDGSIKDFLEGSSISSNLWNIHTDTSQREAEKVKIEAFNKKKALDGHIEAIQWALGLEPHKGRIKDFENALIHCSDAKVLQPNHPKLPEYQAALQEKLRLANADQLKGQPRIPGEAGNQVSTSRPDLAGVWYGYDPRIGTRGNPQQIIQNGDKLTFINEFKQQSDGRFIDQKTIIATDWEGGLKASLEDGNQRIAFANGSFWQRANPSAATTQAKPAATVSKKDDSSPDQDEANDAPANVPVTGSTVVANTEEVITISGLNMVSVNKIRLLITEASGLTASGERPDSARVGEVEFYDKGARMMPSSVAAESVFSGYSTQQATDGNRQYRYLSDGPLGWASADKDSKSPTWIEFSFAAPVNVDKVVVTTAPSNPYRLNSFELRTTAASSQAAATSTNKSSSDVVQQSEQLAGDGVTDSVFNIRVLGTGSIIGITIRSLDGQYSVWDTTPANGNWLLGVVRAGQLLNSPDGHVAFDVDGTTDLDLQVADNGSLAAGNTHFRIDITMADGKVVSLEPAVSHTVRL